MHPSDFQHCLLVPKVPGSSDFTLYELSPCPHFSPNGFVLVPYQHPRLGAAKVQYYQIISEHPWRGPEQPFQTSPPPISLRAKTSHQEYLHQVLALKKEIQQGNIYEINYCIRFVSEPVEADAIDLFLKLNKKAKAPYTSLFKSQQGYIVCASPELFLKKEGDVLLSKPIKGTIRRGKNMEEDEQLRSTLYHSEKERTEHVMAVDVARNDLSQLASKGSVLVDELYAIESFETVHQMVSTVRCNLLGRPSFARVLSTTFPMASMTGAPKRSAMDLIQAHENFERREYSGAMGRIDKNGDYELAVIIRSIFYDANRKELSFAVGGAITYLSDPEEEYRECLLKAETMLQVLNATIVL